MAIIAPMPDRCNDHQGNELEFEATISWFKVGIALHAINDPVEFNFFKACEGFKQFHIYASEFTASFTV